MAGDLFGVEGHLDPAAVETEGFIVKVLGEGQQGDRTGTNQLPADHFEKAMQGEIITPLYDPMVWAFLLEQNTRLKRLVQAMADNTVGLGLEVVPRREDEELTEDDKKAFQEERRKFVELIENLNPDEPITEVCKKVKIDEESTGQGYYEVVRSLDGKVKQLFHLPSYTMRRAKSLDGKARYVQMLPNDQTKKTWFKEFGEPALLDSKTGRWVTPAEASLSPEFRSATEVAAFRLYTPRSSFYGVPRVVPSAPAIAGTRLAQRRNVAFFENDAPQDIETPTLTPHGWIRFGDIRVGSEVIGRDGTAKRVTEVIPQGRKQTFTVHFQDGSATNCTAGHLWTVTSNYDRKCGVTRDMTLQQIMDSGVAYEGGVYKWAVPMVEPVQYAPNGERPIDAYLFGLLLGDGCFRDRRVTLAAHISDADEIEAYVPTVLPDGIQWARRDRGGWAEFHARRADGPGGVPRKNVFYEKIESLGLGEKLGHEKFIPTEYLYGSVDDRVALLQGLVDSDGHIGETAVRYVTKSAQLARDVQELVGSLGGAASLRAVKGRDQWQLTIRQLPEWITPARLSRKANAYEPSEALRWRTIVGIEERSEVETQCIRVDTPDSLYVTENFIVTHNTPRCAVIVSGGELSDESMEQMKEFIEARGKGPGNAGRLMILQAKAADSLTSDAKQVGIQLIPLTVGVQDDASFQRYIAANNEEIREAFGIGQIFIGTSDDVNRAVALAMKQLTVEQVFEPESSRYEYYLNRIIMGTNGSQHCKLRFRRPRTTDIGAESQAMSVMAAAGGVTPNDMRDFQRKPRFNAVWADTPIALITKGLLEDKDDETATLLSVYGDKIQPPQPEGGAAPAKESTPVTSDEALSLVRAKLSEDDVDFVQSIARELREKGYNVSVKLPGERGSDANS